jgi:hypothetical protein
MDPTRLPAWLRITLVAGIAVLIAGASLFAWRWYSKPTTLTVAVGSLDGEASRLVTAIARKLTQSNAPVRFSMIETGSALEAADTLHQERPIWRWCAATSAISRRRGSSPSSHTRWPCWSRHRDRRSPIWRS